MKRLLPLCVAALLVVLVGCETTPTGTAGGSTSHQTISEKQLELLDRIIKYQERTGVKLEALASEAERRQALAEAAAGPPDVVKDLGAAQSVLSQAAAAAQVGDEDRTASALGRLSGIVLSMRAELPAAVMCQQVERAMGALQATDPRLHEASAALLVALDTGVRNTTPRLVPEVLKDIQLAKGHVDNARPVAAVTVLEAVLRKSSKETVARLLAKAGAGVAGAQDALQREAWPVVQAELIEVDRLLGEASARVQPTPEPVTGGESAEPMPTDEGEAPAGPSAAASAEREAEAEEEGLAAEASEAEAEAQE